LPQWHTPPKENNLETPERIKKFTPKNTIKQVLYLSNDIMNEIEIIAPKENAVSLVIYWTFSSGPVFYCLDAYLH
jgi:hypothetical protein